MTVDTKTAGPRPEGSKATGAPNAWAVWGAWQGTPGNIAGIARVVKQNAPDCECEVQLEVGAGIQAIDPDHLETDLPARYARSFRSLKIEASSDEQRIEAEFDNERDRTRARGVCLRVWSPDQDEAIQIRDSIAVAIDGGRGPMSGDPAKGPPSTGRPDEALWRLEKDRNGNIAFAGLMAVAGMVAAAGLVHRFADLDPDSAAARLLFFCLCENKWLIFALYGIGIVVALFLAGPRIFPPVEISDRSTFQRVRARVLGFAGATFGFNLLLEVIADGLPSP